MEGEIRREGEGLLHHVRHGLMDSKLKLGVGRGRREGRAEPITFPP